MRGGDSICRRNAVRPTTPQSTSALVTMSKELAHPVMELTR